ncbi:hypothetical protein TNCV_3965521 [Trichonephila clavipes]|nr:hypothetical protein TNCV_3965521 [Trichonephila clavipes]
MMFMQTDDLFNGLVCKAVPTSATFVFIMNALPDYFLSVTDPVSLVKETDSWSVCHQFEPGIAEGPPFKEAIHVKSCDSLNILPLMWCGSWREDARSSSLDHS